MKKFLIILLLACVSLTTTVQAEPAAARLWGYANYIAVLSPDWSFMVMPGGRWEVKRVGTPATKDNYLNELFVGPVYTMNLSDSMKLKVPVWYYYMDFPNRFTETRNFSHNIEVVPTLEFKLDANLTLVNRVILHNTIYSSAYANDDQRNGFSMLMREMVQINYALNPSLSLTVADEIFYGLITDTEALPIYGPGFSPAGLVQNRVYAGFSCKITPELSIVPQVVYETNWNNENIIGGAGNGTLKETDWYGYLTINYAMKFF